ncbi:MAG: hypothetical protein V8R80_04840 [Eubacterium sp.]
MKILVTPTSLQPDKGSEALEILKEFCDDLVFNPTGRPLTEDEIIPLLKDCDGYVAGLDFITKKVIDACPKLKVISRYGVGYDRVDVEAAKAAGVIVTNTPGVNSEAVGELAFALVLAVARKIPHLNDDTRAGGWMRVSPVLSVSARKSVYWVLVPLAGWLPAVQRDSAWRCWHTIHISMRHIVRKTGLP